MTEPLATAELTVIGLGSSDPASSGFLAAIHQRLAAQQKVSASVHGMGASLAGPLDDIFALAAELHRIPLELGMPHVFTVLKVEQSAGDRGPARTSGATAAQSLNGAHADLRGQAEVAAALAADPASGGHDAALTSRNGAHAAGGGGRGDTIVDAIAAGLVDAGEAWRPPTTAASVASSAFAPPLPLPVTHPRPVAEPTQPTVVAVPLAPPPPPITVRVASLTKTYGEGATGVEALKGIDLEIRRGEFVAVMGSSGSGKSTLMHILGALEEPTSGTVEIGGVSYAGLDDKAQTQLRRDRIGFVFQFFNLLKTLSAEENVMLPSLIAGEPASKLRDRARELLGLVGLDARRDHLPSQLSGGEQQRVSIARALMRNPQLLLADEPTGNLDSHNSAVVLDLLGRLRAESNHTILMVTHDPFAAARATRVVFLRDGLVAGDVPGGDRDRVVECFSALSAQAAT